MLPERENICAIVVTFYPAPGLRTRIEAILGQVARAVIVDNGSPAELLEELDGIPGLLWIRNTANLGVARALNQGMARAREAGHDWGLLLDQDSAADSDMAQTLVAVYREASPRPAVVGSNYFNTHKHRDFIRCGAGRPADHVERKTVITSGSLLDLRLAQELGGFREDYFIDSVDHEFCLRARSRGHRIVIGCKPAMRHAIGGATCYPHWLAGLTAFNHSPVRKYYISRNCLVTIKHYLAREPAWCLRQVLRLMIEFASILLIEDHKRKKLAAFFTGLRHGIAGRMGPIQSAWPDGYERLET